MSPGTLMLFWKRDLICHRFHWCSTTIRQVIGFSCLLMMKYMDRFEPQNCWVSFVAVRHGIFPFRESAHLLASVCILCGGKHRKLCMPESYAGVILGEYFTVINILGKIWRICLRGGSAGVFPLSTLNSGVIRQSTGSMMPAICAS